MPRVKPLLEGAVIFGYEVNDPKAYGVIEFDNEDRVISIEEKPIEPKSNYAVPGLYFYDKKVVQYAKSLKPSNRGEIEITDLNLIYLDKKQLTAVKFAKGTAWLDAGSAETLFESCAYVQAIQSRQGIKIGCIEEECFKRKYISKEQLKALIEKLPNCEYKKYLNKLL